MGNPWKARHGSGQLHAAQRKRRNREAKTKGVWFTVSAKDATVVPHSVDLAQLQLSEDVVVVTTNPRRRHC